MYICGLTSVHRARSLYGHVYVPLAYTGWAKKLEHEYDCQLNERIWNFTYFCYFLTINGVFVWNSWVVMPDHAGHTEHLLTTLRTILWRQ